MNSNAYVFPLWKKHLPNLMMQQCNIFINYQPLMEKNWTCEGRSLQTRHSLHLSLDIYIYVYMFIYIYIDIFISYFNCEIPSHLKLAIWWVDLNLLKFALQALEIANQASTTMKHKPLVWTPCAFGRPWEGKSSLDPVSSVGKWHVADISEVKLCLLRSKCAIQCEYFHAK